MRYLFIIMFLTLSACGPIPQVGNLDPRSINSTDAEFIPYVNKYIAEKGTGMFYDIPIGFAHLNNPTVGLCTRWSNGYRQIQVDIDYWTTASHQLRVSLIAHELGHCDLNRDHSLSSLSIMYYQNIGSNNFYELFGRTTINSKSTLNEHNHNDCVHDIEVE